MSHNERIPQSHERVSPGAVSFTHAEIFAVVDDFYKRIQFDPLLEVPFRSVHDWPEHIERLTHFWWIRFGGQPYLFSQYNPVAKHYFAGFNEDLLQRWLLLFHQVLEKNLSAEQVQFWKVVSERMGQGLSIRNEMFRSEYEQDNTQS